MKEKIKKTFNNRIVSLLGILLFIAACIGVGAGIAYVEHNSDPTEKAVEYFRAFVQKDYEKMYSCLNQKEECYVDKNLYISTIKAIRDNIVIDSYEIGEPQNKDGRIMVTMECKDEDAGKSEYFDIFFAPSVPRSSDGGDSVTCECIVQLRSYFLWQFNIMDCFENSYEYVKSIANFFHLEIDFVQENRMDFLMNQSGKG